MSPITVPKSLQTFFNTFPLYEHPSHPQTTTEERNFMKSKHINFQITTATKPSAYYFKLCTYNTFILTDAKSEGHVLATDPLSLFLQIQLALKQGLKLGKVNKRGQEEEEEEQAIDLKANSVFVINHHGSEDGLLPLYIERNANEDKPGVIKSFTSLNEQLLRELTANSERLLIKLADIALYDFFMFTVLLKVNSDVQLKLFTSHSTQQEKLLNCLALKESLSCLIKRNGFDLRYPNIANHYDPSIFATLTNLSSYYGKAIETEYETALSVFKQATKNLCSVYDTKDCFYQEGASIPGLLDIKISSFIIIANEFLNNTEFGEELRACSQLNRLAEAVLKCVTLAIMNRSTDLRLNNVQLFRMLLLPLSQLVRLARQIPVDTTASRVDAPSCLVQRQHNHDESGEEQPDDPNDNPTGEELLGENIVGAKHRHWPHNDEHKEEEQTPPVGQGGGLGQWGKDPWRTQSDQVTSQHHIIFKQVVVGNRTVEALSSSQPPDDSKDGTQDWRHDGSNGVLALPEQSQSEWQHGWGDDHTHEVVQEPQRHAGFEETNTEPNHGQGEPNDRDIVGQHQLLTSGQRVDLPLVNVKSENRRHSNNLSTHSRGESHENQQQTGNSTTLAQQSVSGSWQNQPSRGLSRG
ncbi:hypothetical protein WICPIJ_007187 [Wickerhamomyces pijperi]|uniref:Uncharacterized protein n=1 Tax=Wickerhamomyces pijperi TaxID=599730 RepID=A0A9P8Q0Q0_WICPI|nr:hypothetical protein WICPIJ_007187 [Wickerhamomyces pijperi]